MENIYEAISNLLAKGLNDLFKMLSSCLSDLNSIGTDLFDINWVKSALEFFQMLGFALFISGLSLAIYNIATDYSSYRNIDFKKHILPVFLGCFFTFLFTKLPPILYSFSCSLQHSFSQELIKVLTGEDLNFDEISINALGELEEMIGKGAVLAYIYLFITIYAVIKIFIATLKRSGTLFAMIGVGSLYCFSISYAGFDNFLKWAKQIIALCVTAFLQTTLLILGLFTMTYNGIVGLGLMLSAGEVNKVAGQFGLDVSAKDSVNSFKQVTLEIIRTGKMLGAI